MTSVTAVTRTGHGTTLRRQIGLLCDDDADARLTVTLRGERQLAR